MAGQLLVIAAVTALAILVTLYFFRSPSSTTQDAKVEAQLATDFPEAAPYIKKLALELPGRVLLPKDVSTFQKALNSYWSQQNRDIIPACIVQPSNTQELAIAVQHLAREHSARAKSTDNDGGLFAIRGGGANPANGISGVKDGVLLDLSLFNQVTPAEDGLSVTVGAGAYWAKVYKALEARGLGVAGGRTSPVGVGGSTLQGGLSYHSPKYGFICSNVISYKVVLADGSIVTASEDEHHDLWLALKGGANNFGVVASFTYKTFPTDKIWSGQYLGAGFLAKKSFTALHEYIKYAADPVTFDERASVPITSINYLGMGGTPLLYTQLTYSEPTKTGAWPQYWKKSPFSSLWRLPIGAGNKTVHDVVQSLGEFTPSGFRNTYGTTTLRNNLETILAAHQIAKDCTPLIKHVKGGAHVMIFQTILPQWINRGTPNVLGLEDCKEPLIIVNFSVSWSDPKDDELMSRTTRDTITKIEEVAAAHNANHPYRFTNYASEWQRPLEGYGQKNIEFMQKVSREYDPNGLFQTGCLGGFKLGMKPEKGTDSSLVAS